MGYQLVSEVIVLAAQDNAATFDVFIPENNEADGIIAYLEIHSAPGVDTVNLALAESNHNQTVWRTMIAASAIDVTGLQTLRVVPGITNVAASTATVSQNSNLPRYSRLRVAHSGVGVFNYTLSYQLVKM